MRIKGWVGFSDGKLDKYSPEYNGEIAFAEFYTNGREARMSYQDVRPAVLIVGEKRKRKEAKRAIR